MLPVPSLDSLRCFVEAARLRNFRSAARAVALTPAALGQRIRQLEDQLDARLFHRTTRSVTLTERGVALLPIATRALDAAADCVRATRGEQGARLDLTIGTRHELGLSWLLPLRARLAAARPGLRVHLYFGSGPDLLHRIRTCEIDCAVTSSILSDPKLDGLALHEETYTLVGQARALRARPLRRPEQAAVHTLIDIAPGTPLFRYLREAAGEAPLRFADVVHMGTIAAVRDLVLAGEGVAVLPTYFVADELKRGRLARLLPRVRLASDRFRLVHRADDPRRGVFERLAAVLGAAPLR